MTDTNVSQLNDRYCGARKKQTEGTCERPAGWGTEHPGIGRCKLHGGSSPRANHGAEKIKAERMVATLGLPREIDPHVALMEEVWRCAGRVAALSEIVGSLDNEGTDPLFVDTMFGPALSHWVRLEQQERLALVAACKAAVSCGVSERLVRLAEKQADLLAQVVRAIFDDPELGLTEEQRRVAPAVARRQMLAVAS